MAQIPLNIRQQVQARVHMYNLRLLQSTTQTQSPASCCCTHRGTVISPLAQHGLRRDGVDRSSLQIPAGLASYALLFGCAVPPCRRVQINLHPPQTEGSSEEL